MIHMLHINSSMKMRQTQGLIHRRLIGPARIDFAFSSGHKLSGLLDFFTPNSPLKMQSVLLTFLNLAFRFIPLVLFVLPTDLRFSYGFLGGFCL